MDQEKDNVFNIPLMDDNELRGLVGTIINCIDLTPFTALSGKMIGYMYITEDDPINEQANDVPIKNMILLVDKNYETTEELQEFIIDWSNLFGAENEEAVNDLLKVMPDGFNLHIDENNVYIDTMVTRECINNKKVFLVPFTHCSADAF